MHMVWSQILRAHDYHHSCLATSCHIFADHTPTALVTHCHWPRELVVRALHGLLAASIIEKRKPVVIEWLIFLQQATTS
jgi:hypothetical protein